MQKCFKLKDVWLLKELPEDIRKELNLIIQDFGIDLIAYLKVTSE